MINDWTNINVAEMVDDVEQDILWQNLGLACSQERESTIQETRSLFGWRASIRPERLNAHSSPFCGGEKLGGTFECRKENSKPRLKEMEGHLLHKQRQDNLVKPETNHE